MVYVKAKLMAQDNSKLENNYNRINLKISDNLRKKGINIQIAAITYFPKYAWTISYLIEQIYMDLISTISINDGVTLRYEKRAKWLIRRISIYRPPPEFIIYRKDLSKRILEELERLLISSPETLDYVVKRAIEMIFMGLDEVEEPIFNNRYYLWSIKPYNLLKWRFDRKKDQETDPDNKYDINYFYYDSNGNEIGQIRETREIF